MNDHAAGVIHAVMVGLGISFAWITAPYSNDTLGIEAGGYKFYPQDRDLVVITEDYFVTGDDFDLVAAIEFIFQELV